MIVTAGIILIIVIAIIVVVNRRGKSSGVRIAVTVVIGTVIILALAFGLLLWGFQDFG